MAQKRRKKPGKSSPKRDKRPATKGARPRQAATVSMAAISQQMSAGRFDRALAMLEQLHGQRPEHPVVTRKIAQCLTALGRPQAAEQWWQRLCALRPADADAWHSLGVCLRDLRRRDDARVALRRAHEADPEHAQAMVSLFYDAEMSSRLDEMRGWLHRLLAAHPKHPARHHLQALMLEREGEYDQALALMREVPDPTPKDQHYPRWFHLFGRLLDRQGSCREAFEAFTVANRYHRRSTPGITDTVSEYLDQVRKLPDALDRNDYSHWATALPATEHRIVWQVGFPRSGTTLLDQVLDSHPDVTVLSETDTTSIVINMLRQLPGGYPASLDRIDDALALKLRQIYLSTLAMRGEPLRTGHVYVDKRPLGTLDLPLLARLLPEAKVLFSRRHPADVCLSAFMQHFKLNQSMSCFLDMDDTVALYNAAMNCDKHFERVLPFQRRQTVRYESLVEDLEGQARAVLDFLELPWDPAVLAFHEHASQRNVDTASFAQVNRKIYTSAVDRWKGYQASLAQWMPALSHHARRTGYTLTPDDSKVA